MINQAELTSRLSEKGKLNKENLAIICDIFAKDNQTYETLTLDDIIGACYHLMIDSNNVQEKINILQSVTWMTPEEKQRFAFACAVASTGNASSDVLLAILTQPSVIADMATNGRNDWTNNKKYIREYPGNEEWAQQIEIDASIPF